MIKLQLIIKNNGQYDYRELTLTFNHIENEENKQVYFRFDIYSEKDYNYLDKQYYVSIEGDSSNVFEEITNDTLLFTNDEGKYREKVSNIVVFTVS